MPRRRRARTSVWIVATADCAALRETVYAVITDVVGWPTFVGNIAAVEQTIEGDIAVGTRVRATRRSFGRLRIEDLTVTALEPPRRMVLTAQSRGMRTVATIDILPATAGTRLVLSFEALPQTWPARLIAAFSFLFTPTLRRQLTADLADMAREAERRAGRVTTTASEM